jgi:hypothetical protein
MSQNDQGRIRETEPPRYLKDESEPRWHIRYAGDDARSVCVPLCSVRYDESSTIVGSRRPVDEPVCLDCAARYIDEVNDDPETSASLLTSLAMIDYIDRTPRMERTLIRDPAAMSLFDIVRKALFHVVEALIQADQSQPLIRAIVEQIIERMLPSEEELAEVERAIASPTSGPERLVAEIVSALFADKGNTDGQPPIVVVTDDQVSWTAVLAPVGVRGETGHIIAPDCEVTVRAGTPLLTGDLNGPHCQSPVGHVDGAAIVDGYLRCWGTGSRAALDALKADAGTPSVGPTFCGGVNDRRTFGSSEDPTVTFTTLEINAVSTVGRPAWPDHMIALSVFSSDGTEPEV